MPQFLVNILHGLIPPHEGENGLYSWRVAMSSTVMVLIVAIAGHLAFASGWMPGFEKEGFVTRSDFSQLTDITLTKSILELKKEQCSQPPGSKARSTYAELVATYVKKYRELTGKDFEIPDCDSV